MAFFVKKYSDPHVIMSVIVENTKRFVTKVLSVISVVLKSLLHLYVVSVWATLNCLLQFHIATEETKFGFNLEEINEVFLNSSPDKFEGIQFCGVMGMATFTSDKQQVTNEFRSLKSIFQNLKENYFLSDTHFNTISMGMSDDFQLAIGEGSTMVRIGSSIFGTRIYN